MDILLNNDKASLDYHDAIFINGPLTSEGVTSSSTETVAQRLRVRLLTFRTEWFLDTTYGVPYFQRILGKKITKVAIDRIFQEQILGTPGVGEILTFTSTFENRQYELSFSVRALDGSETETISVDTNL